MELITLTKENIETEHICCAISNSKDIQVASKKAWLSERLEEGLMFVKANVRGKAFIEYIPAEKAWSPICAKDYMFIDCLWVSGQYKGQGISNLLLESCINDSKSKGKKGLVIISSNKKQPFLADPKYLSHKGFKKVDEAAPYFELWALPFEEEEEVPSFNACAKKGKIEEPGIVVYYSRQCPFTAKYVPVIEEAAKEHGIPFTAHLYENTTEAQAAPVPVTSYSLFSEGQFVTQEILSKAKFEKLFVKEKE